MISTNLIARLNFLKLQTQMLQKRLDRPIDQNLVHRLQQLIEKSNSCHNPSGPAGGQFCSAGSGGSGTSASTNAFPNIQLHGNTYLAERLLESIQRKAPELIDLVSNHIIGSGKVQITFEKDAAVNRAWQVAGGDKNTTVAGFASGKIVYVSTERMEYPRAWAPGFVHTVSATRPTERERIEATLVHELAHTVHFNSDIHIAGPLNTTAQAQHAKSSAITYYGRTNHYEYIAETVSAYIYHNEDLKKFDPTGHAMVKTLFSHAKPAAPPVTTTAPKKKTKIFVRTNPNDRKLYSTGKLKDAFKNAGVTTRSEFDAKLKGIKPTGVKPDTEKQYHIKYDGQKVPLKQVVTHVTGVPGSKYTTHSAAKVVEGFGYTIHKADGARTMWAEIYKDEMGITAKGSKSMAKKPKESEEPDWDELRRVASLTADKFDAGTLTEKEWEKYMEEAKTAVGTYTQYLECIINLHPRNIKKD